MSERPQTKGKRIPIPKPPRRTIKTPPPWELPNWKYLTRQQRRYSIERYNVFLKNHGKRPIDLSSFIDTPQFNEPTIKYTGEPLNYPTDGNRQQEPKEPTPNRDFWEPDFDEPDNDFPDEVDNRLDSDLPDTLPIVPSVPSGQPSDKGPVPGTSGYKPKPTPDPDGPEPLKKRKTTPSTTTTTTTMATPMDTNPPPTAGGTDRPVLPGTGGDNKATESGDVRWGPAARPIQDCTKQMFRYKKVHRFFTYGVAHTIITKTDKTIKNYLLTTSLANIPWDRYFFYLNPSEYKLIPEGAFVKFVSVEVTARNVRVAYPTNSSNSDLATLNQNKDIIFAKGLRQNLSGVDVKYTSFSDADPMVPTDCDIYQGPKDWVAYAKAFYGVSNDKTDFNKTIPCHQVGKPYALRHYYCMSTHEKDPYKSGWPCLQSFVQDWDADQVSGTTALTMTYKPDVAPMKTPLKAIYTGFPANTGSGTPAEYNVSVPDGSNHPINVCQKIFNFSETEKGLRNITTTTEDIDVITDDCFNYYDLIEKGQVMFNQSTLSNDMCKTQPSLHIGVAPTLALNTLSSLSETEKYTDVQGMFEVEAQMAVEYGMPTHRPFAPVANITVAKELMRNKDLKRVETDSSAIVGLYRQPRNTAVPNNPL